MAEAANKRLAVAGAPVTTRVGDGSRGRPDTAPYDRVILTYAVDTVPWPLIAQTRPGGRIVAPWSRLGYVALTVADDGRSARGWMQGLATFMPARGTAPGRPLHRVRGTAPPVDERPWHRALQPLHTDGNLLFALWVLLPEVRIATESGDGVTAWLHDGHASWTTVVARPPAPPWHTRAAPAAWPSNSNGRGRPGSSRERRPSTTSA